MPDRLDYIKQKLDEYKKSPAVILRHSDGEWAVGEIERLREENKGLMKLKEITFKEAEDLLDHDDFNDLIHNIAIEVKNIEPSKTL
jgi:hypothetical protein